MPFSYGHTSDEGQQNAGPALAQICISNQHVPAPQKSICAEEKKGCPFEPLGYSPTPKNIELHVTTNRTVGILWDDVLEFTHWAPVL